MCVFTSIPIYVQDEEERGEEEPGRADERPKMAPPDYVTVENSDLPTYEEAVRQDSAAPVPGAAGAAARFVAATVSTVSMYYHFCLGWPRHIHRRKTDTD